MRNRFRISLLYLLAMVPVGTVNHLVPEYCTYAAVAGASLTLFTVTLLALVER
jgi:hypothetical protein